MQAIRVHQFGDVDQLKLEEMPDPTPGPSQVRIRIRAAGVNPVDTYIRSGKYPTLPKLPYIPGTDAAGEIDALGDDVKEWKKGDRVYSIKLAEGFGSYATHALADASMIVRLPKRITFPQGAGVNVPYGTAYRGLFHRAKVQRGETVLIHGATGGVGLAATQLAVNHGCIVFGTGGTSEGRALVKKQGAADVFDHHDNAYVEAIIKRTDGKGVNAIIEFLANENLDKDLGMLAKFGRVIVIGSRGKIEIDPRQTMGKETSVMGMSYWAAGDNAVAEAQRFISNALEDGELNPIVDKEFALKDAAKAHEDVLAKGSVGKIVLTIS